MTIDSKIEFFKFTGMFLIYFIFRYALKIWLLLKEEEEAEMQSNIETARLQS